MTSKQKRICNVNSIYKNTHWPPKSCMPSRAKTTMKRKSRNNRLMIDFMEFSRDTTRFLKEFQYLLTQIATWSNILWYDHNSQQHSPARVEDSLGDFEDPEESQSPKDTDPKWCSRFDKSPDHLENTANNHLWTQSDECCNLHTQQSCYTNHSNIFFLLLQDIFLKKFWIIWSFWCIHTLKITMDWLSLHVKQNDSPQSRNSWRRNGNSSVVPGYTFSLTSQPKTGQGTHTQPGLRRDNERTHRSVGSNGSTEPSPTWHNAHLLTFVICIMLVLLCIFPRLPVVYSSLPLNVKQKISYSGKQSLGRVDTTKKKQTAQTLELKHIIAGDRYSVDVQHVSFPSVFH